MSNDNYFLDMTSLINQPEKWTKEDYYNAFLDVTVNYYNELINVLNYERTLIEELGEEEGERLIDEIATISPMLDLDEELNELTDVKDRIKLLTDYVEKFFGDSGYEGDSPANITPLK